MRRNKRTRGEYYLIFGCVLFSVLVFGYIVKKVFLEDPYERFAAEHKGYTVFR